MNIEDDLCDFQMSNTAIYESRLAGLAPGLPYKMGYRRKRPLAVGRPSLRQLLDLNDEDFRRFVQNGCQWPGEHQDFESELMQLRSELAALRSLILSLGVDPHAEKPS